MGSELSLSAFCPGVFVHWPQRESRPVLVPSFSVRAHSLRSFRPDKGKGSSAEGKIAEREGRRQKEGGRMAEGKGRWRKGEEWQKEREDSGKKGEGDGKENGGRKGKVAEGGKGKKRLSRFMPGDARFARSALTEGPKVRSRRRRRGAFQKKEKRGVGARLAWFGRNERSE